MKKKLVNLIPALLIGVSSFAFSLQKGNKQIEISERNQKIYEVVERDLSSFLENIPAGFEKQHGFNSRAEFAQAKAGSIYRIYGVDANGKVFTTDNYNLTVVVDNEYRAVLNISFADGKYQIQSVGGAQLAIELQAIEKEQHPAEQLEKVMLNFYDKKCGLVAYKDEATSTENADLTPLESAKLGINNTSARAIKPSYKLAEVIELLK
jgi:ABC-type Na+ efflux pump permease subunit